MVVVVSPAVVRVRRGVLFVKYLGGGREAVEEFPLAEVEGLVVVGNGVSFSSALFLYLAKLDVPVVVHGRGEDVFLYRVFSRGTAVTRRLQYQFSWDSVRSLNYAAVFVKCKLAGFKSILGYYGSVRKTDFSEAVGFLEECVRSAGSVGSLVELRSIEARGSQVFWRNIKTILPEYLGFEGRVPRRPDPVNRAVDYAYSILYGLCFHALVGSGLDPYAGFMHSERSGRPSLVYDFSEMFKPAFVHAVLYASLKARSLSVGEDGLLEPRSTAYVSKVVFSWIKKRRRRVKHSIRESIYLKAFELAKSIREGSSFSGYIYRVW